MGDFNLSNRGGMFCPEAIARGNGYRWQKGGEGEMK